MGAGIFVLTGEAARNLAGPAVVISYLISGLSALLSVLCYTEFAVELPVAGGSFAYLRVELGDFMAYIAAGNILFECIVAGALALIVRRYYVTGETSATDRNKLIGFLTLIIGASIASAGYWVLSNGGWIGYVVVDVIIWFDKYF
ncbi:cationic amino acid transporter 1-like [Rosa rugosa]|uniref:cationic amino acid transporter 1-like n=1 Tax=Rosa rugosa TaxID=74645 RepID=UPI002B409B07|nr:cationic amino acid transporter 1-like [Rosa rugosa]